MKLIRKYAGLLLMLTLLVGFTSCESEDETEFNLPGEWYTNEEIDYGAYTWGRGTVMTFNARNQGTIGSIGDPFGERKLPAGHLVEHGIIHGKISGIG